MIRIFTADAIRPAEQLKVEEAIARGEDPYRPAVESFKATWAASWQWRCQKMQEEGVDFLERATSIHKQDTTTILELFVLFVIFFLAFRVGEIFGRGDWDGYPQVPAPFNKWDKKKRLAPEPEVTTH